MVKQTILTYPNFGKPLFIHADSRNVQMGGVISQKDQPIVYFLRKLGKSQHNYTTMEKELLSLVEALK